MLRSHQDGLLLALIVLATALVSDGAAAQSYPTWFLRPIEVQCKQVAVGYCNSSYYADSAIARAYHFACEVYAINQRSTIIGTESFWATEGGTIQTGSEFNEEYDVTLLEEVKNKFSILDKYIDRRITLVLVGDSSCLNGAIPKIVDAIDATAAPDWTTSLPEQKGYLYAVGVTQQFYYETNSWNIAEQHARLNLARRLRSHVESLQKSTVVTGEALQRERIGATLHHVEVVERWCDTKNGALYVLSRMPAADR